MDLTALLTSPKTPNVQDDDPQSRRALLDRFLKIRHTTDWLTEPFDLTNEWPLRGAFSLDFQHAPLPLAPAGQLASTLR